MEMWGVRMATTSQGDGLIMTFEKDVYTFKSESENSFKWSKEPFNLLVARMDHAMLPVPTSFLEHC